MKQKLLYLVCVLLGLHMPLAAQFSGGSGTADDPYQITTAEQLAYLNNYLDAAGDGKYFRLMNDIDLAGLIGTSNAPAPGYSNGWTPVGNAYSNYFAGSFDGGGFTIKGLWIDLSSTDNVGLFGYVNTTGSIKDLAIEVATGGITGQGSVGALVGALYSGSISGCSATGGIVTGNNTVGGLVGLQQGTLTGSYVTVSVAAEGYNAYVGGLTGSNEGSITTSYATVSVTAGGEYARVGGLTGYNNGSITNSYATGSVAAEGYNAWVGGLTGFNGSRGSITTSYATGSVTATNPSSIAGRLIGVIYKDVVNKITSCYYLQDENTNKDLRGVGGYFDNNIGGDHPYDNDDSYPPELTTNAAPLTDSEMASEASYLDWDFTYTWHFIESQPYPVLQVFGDFTSGDGSETDPYVIRYASQLNNVRNHLDKHFTLTNDIDLTQWIETNNAPDIPINGWMPIGKDATNAQTSFTGSFDGQGYKITGLWINRPDMDYVGLFGALHDDGTLQNVKVVLDANGVKGNNYVGGLAGRSWGEVTSCSVEGSGTVTAGDFMAYFGGLTGYNAGSITTSYATGSVTGGGNNALVGGLTGSNMGSITTSYTTGSVAAGGDKAKVGGLTGYHVGSITTSYATGSVTAGGDKALAGGLTGYNEGSITTSYAIGSVTATKPSSFAGGLIGTIGENTENKITSCYYLQEGKTNRALRGVGGYYDLNDGTDHPYANGSYPPHLLNNAAPLAVADMKKEASYNVADWYFITDPNVADPDNNFVWLIDEGATSPYLWWQYDAAYRPVPVAEPLDNTIYHTVTLVVDSGIQLYNQSPGPLVVEDGGHLYLQFLPESPGLTADDLILTINGTDTPFKNFGSNNYYTYILNPVDKDYEIHIGLRDNTVGNAVVATGNVSVAVESGQLIVDSAHPVDVAVYSITGQAIAFVRAMSGTKMFDLPAGIYIVRAGETTTKVVIND